MHPKYLEIMSKTNADKIFIVGGDCEKEIFKNADKRFVVAGKLNDITPILKQLDTFAYMLNPNHYGTAEQVLQEAMSAGIVPVVMNNPCEKNLVKHLETGLVANNSEEYVQYINLLEKDFPLRKRLSENAKKYAEKEFSLENLNNQWEKLFSEILKLPKTEKIWKTSHLPINSYNIFLESLGEYSVLFENKTEAELKTILKKPEWSSKTKGTPAQYFDFLGGKELENLINIAV